MEPGVGFLTDEEVTIPNFKGAWLSGLLAWLPRPIDFFVSLLLLVTVSRSLSITRARSFSLVVSFSHCDLCFVFLQLFLRFLYQSFYTWFSL